MKEKNLKYWVGVACNYKNGIDYLNIPEAVWPYTVSDPSACEYTSCVGCMDDGIVIDYDNDGLPALNYNPLANTEDGSCITKVFGCMDTFPLASFEIKKLPPPTFQAPVVYQ